MMVSSDGTRSRNWAMWKFIDSESRRAKLALRFYRRTDSGVQIERSDIRASRHAPRFFAPFCRRVELSVEIVENHVLEYTMSAALTF